jgi:hypothetical protein
MQLRFITAQHGSVWVAMLLTTLLLRGVEVVVMLRRAAVVAVGT